MSNPELFELWGRIEPAVELPKPAIKKAHLCKKKVPPYAELSLASCTLRKIVLDYWEAGESEHSLFQVN
jgi:hypothetical protein